MPMTSLAASPPGTGVLCDFSLEMTGRDVPALDAAAGTLPHGTRVNITSLGTEDVSVRVAAAAAVRERGLVPVPHLTARRMGSRDELEQVLGALAEVGAAQQVLVVGGDPATPAGPYADALSVLRTGLLAEHGVRGVGVAGYPGGHPRIDDATLWAALAEKTATIREQGLEPHVSTQFGFDAEPVLQWLTEARRRGLDAPVRVGVPGPAGVRRLLGHARRFGVATSAGIVQKYGFSLTSLLGTAGPERFLHELADGLDPAVHGRVLLHFYAFGGLGATADWVREFGAKEEAR